MKKKIGILCLLLILCVIWGKGATISIAQAATIGSVLSVPESGWNRYDDSDSKIIYNGNWVIGSGAATEGNYLNTGHYTTSVASYKFKFYGTKLRLIVVSTSTHPTQVPVKIDGVSYSYSEYSSSVIRSVLGFEKTGLSAGYHTVEVINPTAGVGIHVDAIDTDGQLVPYDFSSLKAIASTTNKAITLSWDKIDNASSYVVKRSTTQGGGYTAVATLASTSYIDQTISNNITYYYVINPIINALNGTVSNEATATVNLPAVVGDYLPAAESGWQRYDDTYSDIIYSSNGWSTGSAYDFTGNYQNTGHFTSAAGAYYKFKFYGTKLRLITTTNVSHPTAVPIKIDGTTYYFSEYGSLSRQVLSYSITGLTEGYHTVEVLNPTEGKYIHLDAIDIDEGGEIVHGELTYLAITPNSNNKTINLKWTIDFFATNYQVERSTVQGGSYSVIGTTNKTSYSDTNADYNTTYYYRIYPLGSNIYSNEASSAIRKILTAPDSGWKRFDDTGTMIHFSSEGWSTGSAFDFTGNYMNTGHFTLTEGSYYKFKFVGSKLRLITTTNLSHPTAIPIKIDGVPYTFSEYGELARQVQSFEITGLSYGHHTVEVTNPINGKGIHLDAIDIDGDGDLFPYELTHLTASTSTTGDSVILNWTINFFTTTFQVERSTTSGGNYTAIGTTDNTTFTDTNVNPNETYYYRIYPYGNNGYSNEVFIHLK